MQSDWQEGNLTTGQDSKNLGKSQASEADGETETENQTGPNSLSGLQPACEWQDLIFHSQGRWEQTVYASSQPENTQLKSPPSGR